MMKEVMRKDQSVKVLEEAVRKRDLAIGALTEQLGSNGTNYDPEREALVEAAGESIGYKQAKVEVGLCSRKKKLPRTL